jgi:hypothetical protein
VSLRLPGLDPRAPPSPATAPPPSSELRSICEASKPSEAGSTSSTPGGRLCFLGCKKKCYWWWLRISLILRNFPNADIGKLLSFAHAEIGERIDCMQKMAKLASPFAKFRVQKLASPFAKFRLQNLACKNRRVRLRNFPAKIGESVCELSRAKFCEIVCLCEILRAEFTIFRECLPIVNLYNCNNCCFNNSPIAPYFPLSNVFSCCMSITIQSLLNTPLYEQVSQVAGRRSRRSHVTVDVF